MSEMNHPPVDPEFQIAPSFEDAFAAKMTTLLAAYKNDITEIQGQYKVTYPVTDRVDIMSDYTHIGGALRIKKLQTLALSAVAEPEEVRTGSNVKLGVHTEDYSVLALEYGQPKYDDLQVADDEDFVWEPYVMSVASYQTGFTDLLDGATGQPLSGGDLVEAAHRLDFFAQQISDEAYECFMRGYDEELTIEAVPLPTGQNRTLQTMFHDFDHQGTHEGLYELHDCFPGCPVETHSQSNQN